MIGNKGLLEIFFREKNVKIIEDLIQENNEKQIPQYKPEITVNWDEISVNNRLIQTNKKANEILDVVFPLIVQTFELDNVSKPKAAVFGRGFVKDILNQQRSLYKHSVGGMIAMMPLLYLLGANPTEMIGLSQIPYLVANFRQYNDYKRADGYIDPVIKSTIYVRKLKEDECIHAVAHEAIHSIHGQKTNICRRLIGVFGKYQLYNEGIAIAMSAEVLQHIEGKIGSRLKYLNRLEKGQRLCSSYHELCDKFDVSRSRRMIKKTPDMPTPYLCSMHDAGYTIIELLRKERGNEIINDIVTNKFKL